MIINTWGTIARIRSLHCITKFVEKAMPNNCLIDYLDNQFWRHTLAKLPLLTIMHPVRLKFQLKKAVDGI